MFITKKKHREIVRELQSEIARLAALLTDQADVKSLMRSSQKKSEELMDRLVDKFISFGDVTTGLTKRHPDENRTYILIQRP